MDILVDLQKKIINNDGLFVITGASGWFGKTTLNLLWEILGAEKFYQKVRAFSSKDGIISIENKFTLPTQSLEKILDLQSIDYLFHYAFLTRDRVNEMDIQSYIDTNMSITNLIISRLRKWHIKGVFSTSSGAVYNQDKSLVDYDKSLLENPYGSLKLKEEMLLTETCKELGISCLILRVFSVMGAFMTKPTAYAVGDFTYQAITHQHIKIISERPVWRSYTSVQDLVCLGLAYLTSSPRLLPLCIDTCGHIVEMQDIALQILLYLKIDSNSISRNWTSDIPSTYVGKGDEIDKLISSLDLNFITFERQVANTIDYLRSIWRLQ
jgi:nucleoside-diphosphate-sugar epimerase